MLTSHLGTSGDAEECKWEEFLEFAVDFRWDMDDAMLLIECSHSYFIQDALGHESDIPSDVLAEYPDMVDEFLKKKALARKTLLKKQAQRAEEKEEKLFWKNF